jgi:DNA invertase Pin-like site-specific DNA recombinase
MLLLGVLADLAEMEKEQLVERINSGLDEARRKNKTLGRPKGSMLTREELLEQYPGVVKDLNGGLSLRKTAAFRKVSLDTVQRVKKALACY